MPQLLIELFSEEIPARMQAGAARDLERLFKARLDEAGLAYSDLFTHVGPRRLCLVVEGLEAAQADRLEELKGPRVGAPPQALEGFLRKTGLTADQLTEEGGVYMARIERKGRPTPEIVAEALETIIRSFPWPKSMRWGSGTLRWVRPLKRITVLFDGAVVPLSVDGICASQTTEGHRFMGAAEPFTFSDFADYQAKLRAHFVLLDAAERRLLILEQAGAVCKAEGFELVPDEGLLDEVCGLAEWPVPVLGDMDPAFLSLPPEVIRTSMRTHQKYFAVRDPKTGGLAPHFVTVANIAAADGGAEIKRGNAKVLSARLNDARFFWDEDCKAGNFDRWLGKLSGVTFHARLGSLAARVERIVALAVWLAPKLGVDPDLAARAARLAKADLASGMVGEFPELQGIMGGYYAREAGLDGALVEAVRDHYRPQGPSDTVPTAPLSVLVALADKLDMLVSFFAIDEKPTGSKDPFALRRAALGIIRLILESGTRLPLTPVLAEVATTAIRAATDVATEGARDNLGENLKAVPPERLPEALSVAAEIVNQPIDGVDVSAQVSALVRDLLAFFADRLKVQLREEGRRHDLVDAVFSLGDDDLVRIVDRVGALDQFVSSEDGTNLLAGYKRANNILASEAKKNPDEQIAGHPDLALATHVAETALIRALDAAVPTLDAALASEEFAAAMRVLAGLRGPVDAFFEGVLVNDPDPAIRLNRLRLLTFVRDTANRVANFATISG